MQDTLVANQLKLSVLHAAVLNRIAQGFLRDTKDAKRRFLCDRIRDIAMDKVNLSPILLRQLTTQSLDREDEARCCSLRVELVGRTMHVGCDLLCHVIEIETWAATPVFDSSVCPRR